MHFEHNNEENEAMQRYIKTILLSFTFIKVTKGFVIVAFVKGNDTVNNNTSLQRQGHKIIVVKVLALKYKTYCEYVKF